MGALLDRARADWARFTSEGGFEVEMTLEAPSLEIAVVKGLAMDHHIVIDSDGQVMNAKNSHATISESIISDANASYPIRNAAGRVDMKRHKVTYKDSTGVTKTHSVAETFPDETVGVITFILGDRE